MGSNGNLLNGWTGSLPYRCCQQYWQAALVGTTSAFTSPYRTVYVFSTRRFLNNFRILSSWLLLFISLIIDFVQVSFMFIAVL